MARQRGSILRPALVGIGGLLLVVSAALCAEQIWIGAKKRIARTLIADAWTQYLEDGRRHRPWSWADFHPLAELSWIDADGSVRESRIVLSGASGASLAFGIGHVDGTSAPLSRGNCVLAGHRTAEFRFLRRLKIGDRLRLRDRDLGQGYRVEWIEIVPAGDLRPLDPRGGERLTLITCYPFHGLRTSTTRYIVHCRAEPDAGRLPGATPLPRTNSVL